MNSGMLPQDNQESLRGVLSGSNSFNRHITLPGQPQKNASLRENMILQRQTYSKPLTAKSQGHKYQRAQSSNPNAGRYAGNRLGTAT